MLYQKGTERIEVIVRKEGGGVAGINENDVENVTSSSITNSGKKGLKMDDIRRKRFIKTNTSHAFSAFKQAADLGINYYIGGVGQRNGDQAYQDTWQRNMEKVQDVTNIASSVAIGITYGSWGGPVGAAFGAAFGLITSGTSTIVKYAKRQRDFDYKVFKENNAIEYNKTRAGINLTTGRLR